MNINAWMISGRISWMVFLCQVWLLPLEINAAGCEIDEQLYTVQETSISILTGGLLYRPLPGFDRTEFETKAKALVASLLSRCKIHAAGLASLDLVIDLRKSRNQVPEGHVVLHIQAELREPARLVREWSADRSLSRELTVTTWRSSPMSRVVREEEGVSELLELVAYAGFEFAQAVGSARSNLGPPELDIIPESWFDDFEESVRELKEK